MKLTLVISVDKVYFDKATQFGLWDSLIKNWEGRVCILCIGFCGYINISPRSRCKIEIANCNIERFKCYRKGWPDNRDVYFCSESGEFMDYFNFDDEEIIIHLDGDMILQRPLSEGETNLFKHLEDNEVAMSPYTLPVANLRDEIYKLKPRKGYEKINADFPGRLGYAKSMCTGLVAANKYTWNKIRDYYVGYVDRLIGCFDHHAASQWLLNYIVNQSFTLYELSNVIHNAAWFVDTGAVDGDQLLVENLNRIRPLDTKFIVVFNHTKFSKEYKF